MGLACVVSMLTGALVLVAVVEPRFRFHRVLIVSAGEPAVAGLVALLAAAMWTGNPGLAGWVTVLGSALCWVFRRRRAALAMQLRDDRVRLYQQRHSPMHC